MENDMWDRGALGERNPAVLLHTVWYLTTKELMVYYGEEYRAELGVNFEMELTIHQENRRPGRAYQLVIVFHV